MKQIIFLFAALIMLGINSARGQSMTMQVIAAEDTLTNADTARFNAQITGAYSLTFGIKGVRLSGTAAGSIALYGSYDGINYRQVTTSTELVAFQADTLVNVAEQVHYYFLPHNIFRYYRVDYIASGTVSLKPTATIYYKPL